MKTSTKGIESIDLDPMLPIGLSASTFQMFFHKLAHGGYLLFPAALVAIFWSNIDTAGYNDFWHTPFALSLGSYSLTLPLSHWVNDVFMTFFFFTVGLEIKREILVGGLSDFNRAVLPISAAVGGMIVPALIFFYFNQQLPEAKGWGVPMATDIAFSLAVLGTLGSRIPFAVRLFLTAFAIADDLGAVLIIAVFYTPHINISYLLAALPVIIGLAALNRYWIRSALPYLILGGFLWATVALAGLHATVAGVIVAMFIPARGKYDMSVFVKVLDCHSTTIRENNEKSLDIMLNRSHLNAVEAIEHACQEVETPLQRLEMTHAKWVSLLVLPLFALANMGLVLKGVDLGAAINHPISLGIGTGLVAGKTLGIFLATYLTSKILGLPLVEGFTWLRVLGVGFLGGVGFTMSLFISSLSYVNPLYINYAKVGIIWGSLLSALCGYFILRFDTRVRK